VLAHSVSQGTADIRKMILIEGMTPVVPGTFAGLVVYGSQPRLQSQLAVRTRGSAKPHRVRRLLAPDRAIRGKPALALMQD
jgi:hypothetical protein